LRQHCSLRIQCETTIISISQAYKPYCIAAVFNLQYTVFDLLPESRAKEFSNKNSKISGEVLASALFAAEPLFSQLTNFTAFTAIAAVFDLPPESRAKVLSLQYTVFDLLPKSRAMEFQTKVGREMLFFALRGLSPCAVVYARFLVTA
jgi:hypothetical protein